MALAQKHGRAPEFRSTRAQLLTARQEAGAPHAAGGPVKLSHRLNYSLGSMEVETHTGDRKPALTIPLAWDSG